MKLNELGTTNKHNMHKEKKWTLKSDVPVQISKLWNKVQNKQRVSKAPISVANYTLLISFPSYLLLYLVQTD